MCTCLIHVYAYLLISINSINEGLGRIEPNFEKISKDLNNNSVVLAEAIQSILRNELVENSYDLIKDITRNNNSFSINDIIKNIENKLDSKNKEFIINKIKNLNVNNYTGIFML